MAAYAQPATAPVSVSASKGGAKKGQVTLRTVSIDIVEQGFVGRCSYEGVPGKEGYPQYRPDKVYALADRKAVDAFLDELLKLDSDK